MLEHALLAGKIHDWNIFQLVKTDKSFYSLFFFFYLSVCLSVCLSCCQSFYLSFFTVTLSLSSITALLPLPITDYSLGNFEHCCTLVDVSGDEWKASMIGEQFSSEFDWRMRTLVKLREIVLRLPFTCDVTRCWGCWNLSSLTNHSCKKKTLGQWNNGLYLRNFFTLTVKLNQGQLLHRDSDENLVPKCFMTWNKLSRMEHFLFMPVAGIILFLFRRTSCLTSVTYTCHSQLNGFGLCDETSYQRQQRRQFVSMMNVPDQDFNKE